MIKRVLKRFEEILRHTEVKLSGYLKVRDKYRMTDRLDIKRKGLKLLKKKVKTTADLQKFIDYHYYLGKWMAYKYILELVGRELFKIYQQENRKTAKKKKWLIF